MKRIQGVGLNHLFDTYSKGMYNLCLRMLGNRQDAEDVLQDAFLNAFTRIHQLHNTERFGGWLKSIVVNQCLQTIRSRIFFTDLKDLDLQPQEMEDDYLYQCSMEQINKAIRELPDGCRVVFNLYLLENYKHKEIAEMLNISESTSKSQFRRAKQLLQTQLKSRKE